LTRQLSKQYVILLSDDVILTFIFNKFNRAYKVKITCSKDIYRFYIYTRLKSFLQLSFKKNCLKKSNSCFKLSKLLCFFVLYVKQNITTLSLGVPEQPQNLQKVIKNKKRKGKENKEKKKPRNDLRGPSDPYSLFK